MKRKLGCMTMAILMGLSLAACGASKTPAAADTPAAGKETTAAAATKPAEAEPGAEIN